MSWGEEIKCEAWQALFLFFWYKFNKFNKIGPRMWDSIGHMTLKWFKNHIFGVKSQYSAIFFAALKWTS